ncbi:MAG TPA: homoserine kinase [Flavisolibacter sp.]|nr:homoserine kinase [Flavisolibacter sp.]
MKTITIQSPATIANLVCGFDVLGLALHDPCDIITLQLIDKPQVSITNKDDYNLPVDPEKNVAGVVLLSMMEKLNNGCGFEMISEKRIMPGSGIGSSAASAAGAAIAANILLGDIFSKEELVQFAMNGEKLASGVKHADNIAPCIYGGITLVRCIHPLDIVAIPAPDLFVTVVHPQIEVRTADARQILKKEIELKDAIKQWGNVAGLVSGFFKKDYELIGRSLEDVVIEPLRSILIPGFEEVKKGSKEAGALGGGISGSGPSIFMLSRDEVTANQVAAVMQQVYNKLGIAYHTYVTTINQQGGTIIT